MSLLHVLRGIFEINTRAATSRDMTFLVRPIKQFLFLTNSHNRVHPDLKRTAIAGLSLVSAALRNLRSTATLPPSSSPAAPWIDDDHADHKHDESIAHTTAAIGERKFKPNFTEDQRLARQQASIRRASLRRTERRDAFLAATDSEAYARLLEKRELQNARRLDPVYREYLREEAKLKKFHSDNVKSAETAAETAVRTAKRNLSNVTRYVYSDGSLAPRELLQEHERRLEEAQAALAAEKEAGVPHGVGRKRRRMSAAVKSEVTRLKDEQGLSFNRIAELLGHSSTAVTRAYYTTTAKARPQRPTTSPVAIRQEVVRMREELGWSYKQIANSIGCSTVTVWRSYNTTPSNIPGPQRSLAKEIAQKVVKMRDESQFPWKHITQQLGFTQTTLYKAYVRTKAESQTTSKAAGKSIGSQGKG